MKSYDREQRALTISTLLGLFALGLALLAWATAPAKAADEATPVFQKEYPHKWYLGCYQKYGRFDGCMLVTTFNVNDSKSVKKVRLTITITNQNAMLMGVTGVGWRFTEGKEYVTKFYFTKKTGATQDNTFSAKCKGVQYDDGYQGTLGGGSVNLELLGEIMVTKVLGIGFNEKFAIALPMNGSYKAIEGLLQAHTRYSGGAPAGDSFPSTSSLEDTF